MTAEEMQKKRQELYSWSWFYKNSIKNLVVSRYPGTIKEVQDKNSQLGESRTVLVPPFVNDMWNNHYNHYYDESGNKRTCSTIVYSQRFEQDKQMIDKVSREIDALQLQLNKHFKK